MAACFDLFGESLKTQLKGLMCCIYLRASTRWKQLPQWCLLKAFKGKYICQHHLDQSIIVATNNTPRSLGMKKPEEKHGKEGLWKFPRILGNVDHTNAQVWLHSQETPENLCSHLWLNFRLCVSRKWKLINNYKLPA